MGWAQFLVYTGVFFSSFVGDQTQTSSRPNFESCNLWCLFTKSCSKINTRTMLQILFSLLCVKYIFFWFYRSIGFQRNNKYAKKRYYISHGMCWHCSFHFRYVTSKMCLLYKFISPGATVFLVFQVFFVFLDKRSELSCCFIEASSEIGKKIKYLQATQRTCQNIARIPCQGLHHW